MRWNPGVGPGVHSQAFSICVVLRCSAGLRVLNRRFRRVRGWGNAWPVGHEQSRTWFTHRKSFSIRVDLRHQRFTVHLEATDAQPGRITTEAPRAEKSRGPGKASVGLGVARRTPEECHVYSTQSPKRTFQATKGRHGQGRWNLCRPSKAGNDR